MRKFWIRPNEWLAMLYLVCCSLFGVAIVLDGWWTYILFVISGLAIAHLLLQLALSIYYEVIKKQPRNRQG